MKTFLFCCLVSLPLFAGENILTSEEKAAGWKLLFDGKTTAGWQGYHQETFPAKGWSIEDGCLKVPRTDGKAGSGGGDIVTDQKFTDFEFKFEFRMGHSGNSGIKYLILEERPGSALGCEYQLLDDLAHPDAKHGPIRQTAALYQLIPPTNKTLRALGEFNEGKLLVQGNHVEHWLNGTKVVEYELGSDELAQQVASSKYKSVPNFAGKVPTRILLQDHGEEVLFRNLKVRELPGKGASKG